MQIFKSLYLILVLLLHLFELFFSKKNAVSIGIFILLKLLNLLLQLFAKILSIFSLLLIHFNLSRGITFVTDIGERSKLRDSVVLILQLDDV